MMQRENEHLELENKMFRQWVTEIEARKHDLLYALRKIAEAQSLADARHYAIVALHPPAPQPELETKREEDDY